VGGAPKNLGPIITVPSISDTVTRSQVFVIKASVIVPENEPLEIGNITSPPPTCPPLLNPTGTPVLQSTGRKIIEPITNLVPEASCIILLAKTVTVVCEKAEAHRHRTARI
jgi:hypothetical protein